MYSLIPSLVMRVHKPRIAHILLPLDMLQRFPGVVNPVLQGAKIAELLLRHSLREILHEPVNDRVETVIDRLGELVGIVRVPLRVPNLLLQVVRVPRPTGAHYAATHREGYVWIWDRETACPPLTLRVRVCSRLPVSPVFRALRLSSCCRHNHVYGVEC